MQESVDILWNSLLRRAREEFPEGTVDVWLSTCLPLSLEDGTFSVDVPNVFVKEQIQSRFLPALESAARKERIAEHVVFHVAAEVR
ncbi:MAG TPA: DnaA N-terminal domain-containing protein, partial [Synergistaceae bacterium]|nr:DnaA N-terminal domain-containing protein [Synergistaceae bacterium]